MVLQNMFNYRTVHIRRVNILRSLVLMLNVANKKEIVNKMAFNGLNRSVSVLLWQSRLRESGKISQNRERNAHRRFNCYLRRRRLVSFLFFSVYYSISASASPCSSGLDQTKIAVVLGRDVPWLGWTRLDWELLTDKLGGIIQDSNGHPEIATMYRQMARNGENVHPNSKVIKEGSYYRYRKIIEKPRIRI